jgi:small-conductance mechanosensitive channel
MINRRIALIIALIFFCMPLMATAATPETEKTDEKKPGISISQDVGEAMVKQASEVRHELKQKALSLFDREPLGWDWKSIDYLYKWFLKLPLEIPGLMRNVIEQSRLLGFVGSILMLTFLSALLYSILGRRRVIVLLETKVEPFRPRIPEAIYPFILSAFRIIVAALIPLLLLAAFSMVNAMIHYTAPWFLLIGRLIKLWAVGSLLLWILREVLTRDLFKVTREYGKTIFRLSGLVLIYVMFGIGLVWGAGVFNVPSGVLALLQFVISVSIVIVLFLLYLNKKAILSLFPDLPYRSYQSFLRFIQRNYYPIIFISLFAGLLWCIGYKQLGRVVLVKIWFTAIAFVFIMLAFHFFSSRLELWHIKIKEEDESAQFFFHSIKTMLVYLTTIATILVIFNLLGLLGPLQKVMSFTVFQLGDTIVTPWILIKAALILAAFIFSSRLLQSYLEYKIYPAMGIEPGLAYALNIFFKYTSYAIGIIISLNMVGLNLQFLLVFAGAIGIGIGLGLQNMAANVIAGFSLIFSGQLRRGDWIQVGDTMGLVTDIYLRATRVRSRANIEYLVPNSDFTSTTLINYTLSSPLISISLPVGVSYNADPRQVSEIMMEVARKEPLIAKNSPPVVRFVSYGDNSINFELIFWIDARNTAQKVVCSNLYFVLFDEFKKAGIEIPFPQRDIHIRSSVLHHPNLVTQGG